MSDERHPRDAAIFERWWDRLIQGRSTAHMPNLDPGLEAFARRVHALDDQPTADPTFKRQLWEDLMHANPTIAALPVLSIPVNGRPRSISVTALPRPYSRRRHMRTRMSTGLSWAATAALIAAIFALIVFTYHQDQRIAVPPLQETSTPVATPPATDVVHDWPMFGGNPTRTRNAPGPEIDDQPGLLWTYPAAGEANLGPSLDRGALADGVLYLPTGLGIAAIDAATGAVLWHAEGYGTTVVVDGDGLIVYGSASGAAAVDLVRIRRSDGGVVWTAEQGKIDPNLNPVVSDGVGYVPSGGDFIAFDPATGEVLWRMPLNAQASRGASVANGLAVLGDQQGTIYGLSIAGGDIVWTYDTDATTIGHPALANGSAYLNTIGGAEEAFVCLDAATGDLKWRFVSPTASAFLTPAVSDTMVYISTRDGNLYALDAETGEISWQFQAGTVAIESPALVGGTLYFSTDTGVAYALDAATGAERWRVQLDGGSDSGTMVVDGVFYLNSSSGTVSALSDTAAVPLTATPADLTVGTPASGTPVSSTVPTFAWATRGGDQEPLSVPLAVVVAPDGTVWVADVPGKFLLFDAGGYYLGTWGSPGTGPGQFAFDGAIGAGTFLAFAQDGSFYVSDINNHRIQHFDKDRAYLGEWGLPSGTGDGQFMALGDIWILPDGSLLVADSVRNDIQHFSPDGTFLDRFDATGTTDGPLVGPAGIAVDEQGRLIVAEVAVGRVRVFDSARQQIGTLDVSDQQPPFYNNAFFLRVDGSGNIHVCDQNNGLIRVFGPDLQFAYQWGNTGEPEARLDSPGWMAFGPGGAIYVTDDAGYAGVLRRFNFPR